MLKGLAISTADRIMSLVDYDDSHLIRRSAGQSAPPLAVLNEIIKNTSEKGDFDPALVKLVVNILKEQG